MRQRAGDFVFFFGNNGLDDLKMQVSAMGTLQMTKL
jgi:hypothetical protein